MSTDISRKLTFLCREHRVAQDQFIEEFLLAYKKPRRLHLREWLSGDRSPHGKSLDFLADYWSRYAAGIERFWWRTPFDEFVQLYERRRASHSSPTARIDRAAVSFAEQELEMLSGVYRLYRRAFSVADTIAVEVMDLSVDKHSQHRLFSRIYTQSHSDKLGSMKEFDGYAYRMRDQYYIMTFLSESSDQYMRSMVLPASSDTNDARVLVGVVLGVNGEGHMPVAERVVVLKIEKSVDHALDEVRRCHLKDIPAPYQELLGNERVEAISPRTVAAGGAGDRPE